MYDVEVVQIELAVEEQVRVDLCGGKEPIRAPAESSMGTLKS
jgi:hypothetical protein